MTRVIDSKSSDAAAVACEVLAAGGLVVIPTDTVYGIAARIDRPDAIRRLFDVKTRMEVKPVAVLAANLEQAMACATFNDTAVDMAREWPGPLTLVLTRDPDLAGIELGGDPASIGIRVPDHELVREILLVSGPVAASSANRAGSVTPTTCGEIAALFGDAVNLYIDGGKIDGSPSRVVSLIDEMKILRDQ
ncbi:MAG: L-threonylcarbamoyladenylate synthase [Actinomycetota bacterium]